MGLWPFQSTAQLVQKLELGVWAPAVNCKFSLACSSELRVQVQFSTGLRPVLPVQVRASGPYLQFGPDPVRIKYSRCEEPSSCPQPATRAQTQTFEPDGATQKPYSNQPQVQVCATLPPRAASFVREACGPPGRAAHPSTALLGELSLRTRLCDVCHSAVRSGAQLCHCSRKLRPPPVRERHWQHPRGCP